MTNIYYIYRYATDNKWNRYSPSYVLQSAYPEWENLYTFHEEKIQTNIPLWKRLGWIEADESIATDVATEIQDNGIGALMKHITPAEAIAYMQYYTDYLESPAGTFEIVPESTDETTGETVPATYLTIL